MWWRRLECFPLALALLGAAGASAQGSRPGVWISAEEIGRLETSSEAWRALRAAAEPPLPPADLAERDSNCDVLCLAKALVGVRLDDERLRAEVQGAIGAVMGTERGGDVLALSRNLPGYVIAADVVGLPAALERRFASWLELVPEEELAGTTMRRIHEQRPNNWGMHAGAARVVVARYLGRTSEVERVAQIFRGWLGERSSYAGFDYGGLNWQADPDHPVGINPRGAQRDGHSLDGVLPDDQRRSGGFSWPPPKENYVYEALQGALLQAMVLDRAGFADVWEWGDRALLRAFLWLEREAGFQAVGDDTWQPYVVNHFYRADLHLTHPSRPGKSIGWTDWTLAPERVERRTPCNPTR